MRYPTFPRRWTKKRRVVSLLFVMYWTLDNCRMRSNPTNSLAIVYRSPHQPQGTPSKGCLAFLLAPEEWPVFWLAMSWSRGCSYKSIVTFFFHRRFIALA